MIRILAAAIILGTILSGCAVPPQGGYGNGGAGMKRTMSGTGDGTEARYTKASGSGPTTEQAIDAAMREALKADSIDMGYATPDEDVLSRSRDYIKSYRVSDTRELNTAGGTVFIVTILAIVDSDALMYDSGKRSGRYRDNPYRDRQQPYQKR